MLFSGLFCVVRGMQCMAMRHVGVVAGLVMVVVLVVLSRFSMVFSGFFVVVGRHPVMFRALL